MACEFNGGTGSDNVLPKHNCDAPADDAEANVVKATECQAVVFASQTVGAPK